MNAFITLEYTKSEKVVAKLTLYDLSSQVPISEWIIMATIRVIPFLYNIHFVSLILNFDGSFVSYFDFSQDTFTL